MDFSLRIPRIATSEVWQKIDEVSIYAIRDKAKDFKKNDPEAYARNTRNEACEKLDDNISFRKHCVFCGEEFETVNESRLACEFCQKKTFAQIKREKAARRRRRTGH